MQILRWELAERGRRRRVAFLLGTSLTLAVAAGGTAPAAEPSASDPTSTFRRYCFQCHGKTAMAGINLENLTSQASVGEHFQQWEKVAAALEQNRMPPSKMPQPDDADRRRAAEWIRTRLGEYAEKHAGDPGGVTVRRLTSGEYAYTIQDLTGLDLKLERELAGDSAGGEGFTNFGDVQFMEDASLERYLGVAKVVASHAVIGAGPIEFFEDPGKSGLELSAISRIREIYHAYGFRAASGEGGLPYGLERYGKAFYAAWRYRYRKALGEGGITLPELAAREGISPPFLNHIWAVLNAPSPKYPTAEAISRWRNLPVPAGDGRERIAASARAGCKDIQEFVVGWTRWLFAAGEVAAGGQGDERALVLTDASIDASPSKRLRFNLRRSAGGGARLYLNVVPVNPNARDRPAVIWRNATVRLRGGDKGTRPPQPLKSVLDEATVQRLQFGRLPGGEAIDPADFAMPGDGRLTIDVAIPEGAASLELQIEAALGPEEHGDAILRCTIAEREEGSRGVPVWALLGNPKSAGFQAWKAGVLEFAGLLPQISHGEPAPSDKDPIPAPFNNTYNQPERDGFHINLKYYRQDRFLVEKILDGATRTKLDHAWTDLLTSFEYHDIFLRFVAGKFKLDLKGKRIADLDEAFIEGLPAEPRKYIEKLHAAYKTLWGVRVAAQPGHVEDCVEFAGKAWRRPLSDTEKARLRSFYKWARKEGELDHPEAIRALLTRILVAPAFLYRLEPAARTAEVRPLSDWEMASRLSYFLWSSIPDSELRRAAASGELSKPEQIQRQVKRMLAHPKARRLATEFFGQWLGFYRFDQYRGVDTGRFPEFTGDVKEAMYDEAVSFFEHIIRKDRPVREVLFADYAFLNRDLAKHYGVKREIASTTAVELVEGAGEFQRGGLLRLGAVLTATSAPLRTSPVKRGDWVLRRVLGTPTPPPPPDAGSIPADDKSFGGLTVRERLAAHQRNPTCAGCHSRIDPLGFPLERYDAVGRWREQYPDGKPIHDSAELGDKTPITGITGLLDYLRVQEKQVLRTLSHKLLGYALGRTALASDQPLIDRLVAAGGEAGISRLAAEIAASRQFRYRREGEGNPPAAPSRSAGAGPPIVNISNRKGGL